MAIRIVIDRELCAGYANCLDAAPEVFDVDGEDVAVVVAAPDTLPAHREAIERAVKLCPINAIALEED